MRKPNVIITGATQGIGHAIAHQFAAGSAHLALIARSEPQLSAVAAELRAKAPACQITCLPCDLSDKVQVQHLIGQLRQAMPAFQVLVNNAGLYRPGALLEEPDEALEEMMRLNLFAPYYLVKGLLPNMQGKRHIFNLSSVASRHVYPGKASYSITKFALQALNDALRQELAERGVRVTAVLPGPTWSAAWAGAELPEERLLQADDVALAIWNAWQMPANAVIEELVIRPQLGDLN